MIDIPSVNPYALDSKFLVGYLNSYQYGIQGITCRWIGEAIPLVVILYENVCQWRQGRGPLWDYEKQNWIQGCRMLFLRRIHCLFPSLYPSEWDFRHSILRGRQFYYRESDFGKSRQWLPLDYGHSVRGPFEDMLRLFWEWLHGNTELG
jgi:hypothetical protein